MSHKEEGKYQHPWLPFVPLTCATTRAYLRVVCGFWFVFVSFLVLVAVKPGLSLIRPMLCH